MRTPLKLHTRFPALARLGIPRAAAAFGGLVALGWLAMLDPTILEHGDVGVWRHQVYLPTTAWLASILGVLVAAVIALATSAEFAVRGHSGGALRTRRALAMVVITSLVAAAPAVGWAGRIVAYAAMSPSGAGLETACELDRADRFQQTQTNHMRTAPTTLARFRVRPEWCDRVPVVDSLRLDLELASDALHLRSAYAGEMLLHIHGQQLLGRVERTTFVGPTRLALALALAGALSALLALTARPASEAAFRRWRWGALAPSFLVSSVAFVGLIRLVTLSTWPCDRFASSMRCYDGASLREEFIGFMGIGVALFWWVRRAATSPRRSSLAGPALGVAGLILASSPIGWSAFDTSVHVRRYWVWTGWLADVVIPSPVRDPWHAALALSLTLAAAPLVAAIDERLRAVPR